VVNLIGSTTTRTGLTAQADCDAASYPIGIKIADAQMTRVHLRRATLHGEWNYTMQPSNNNAFRICYRARRVWKESRG
jgi:hypothetical protein